MFKSNSGKYLFYEIQFLTKAIARLKTSFHESYGVLRTIFGDPEKFNRIIRESLKKMSPEERMAELDFLDGPVRKLSKAMANFQPTSPRMSSTRSDGENPLAKKLKPLTGWKTS